MVLAVRLLGAADSGAGSAPGVPLTVAVDPRVELVSIIFRLAGSPEYGRCLVPGYVKDLDAHFAGVRDHPAVQMARRLRAERGVSFDAPMSLAVHLRDAEGLELRFPLTPWPEGIDRRWRPEELTAFLAEARRFAEAAGFAGFVRAQAGLYEATATAARSLAVEQGRLDWFGAFFGERTSPRFHLIPGLVNGPNCYGPRVRAGTHEEFYCILGVWETDWRGRPHFGRAVLSTVAHEFCHSYVNPLIYARTAQLKPAGEALFSRVQTAMQRQAYGNWQTMLHESVVRAAVVRYLAATQSASAAARQVQAEVARGFLWTDGLAALLQDYEAKREEFPRFEAFLPRIVTFFEQEARLPAPASAAPPLRRDP